ncbi:MAG: DNA-directed RNA polymerase subunit beta [Candidatus Gracilibacteria bacterium]|nr:DNA-directed RNA polymerase subunit beta [Candidatus Peregrinibacteria bacterium]
MPKKKTAASAKKSKAPTAKKAAKPSAAKKTAKRAIKKAPSKTTAKRTIKKAPSKATKSAKTPSNVSEVKTTKKLKTLSKQKASQSVLDEVNTLLPKIEAYIKEESERKFFSERIDKKVPLPNLIEVQIDSYRWFLQDGIRDLLDEITPIQDFSGKKLELHFLEHSIGEPKYDAETCKMKNLTYESPLKVHVQLINKESGEIKEQDVFLGGIPLMTTRGTFIINGIERVVVSQLVRSPGVFFSTNAAAPGMHNAKIIPKRGAWLEVETDKKGIITVKIDRKRKIPITSLLRVFGYATDKEIKDLFADEIMGPEKDFIQNTLDKDGAKTEDEAYQNIYKKIRPGDLATPENAKSLIQSMFFDYRKYDMGPVARYKLNKRFHIDVPNKKENHTFQVSDLVYILKHLIKLNNGQATPDDIDHLSNRRVRAVGELVQNKFRVGLLRTDRIAKDRMTVMDLETVTPTQLVNSRPITAALREFFASSQLSQFMDQTNPLAELAHKRRLSAMGPGGLSRERASFDVRDVHPSHYGRICPISTPEGPNIGLVVHLGTYARVNEYGFIETPFREVKQTCANKASELEGRTIGAPVKDSKGKLVARTGTVIDAKLAKELEKTGLDEIPVIPYVVDDIKYYDADEEKDLIIVQANTELDKLGQIMTPRVSARVDSEASIIDAKEATHMDVSPKQIISETTALIPFLEHDDNTRASMGSNMQRQAVSLISPKAPVVGTGMEELAAKSSGQVVLAEEDGTISYVDAEQIVVLYKNGKKSTYKLHTYQRSNQGTCIHQRALVVKGQKVKRGDILADGAATDKGEVALGQNLLVAYMSWQGFNFEDAVIISDRVVKDGIFDSVHIETFTIDMRDTKLGPEVITRDIPNVGEARLKDLDDNGIIRIGATVHEGDILVGKITPKGETELTAEERLLRAIFGDKARDVKDTSLRLPGGEGGKVVGVQIFSRKNGDELPTGVNQQIKVNVAQTRKISIGDKVAGRHGNKGVISIIVPQEDMPFMPDGTPVDIILNPLGVSSRMNIGQILETHAGWAAKEMGVTVATPALNGISPEQITELLKEANLPTNGKVQLFDGLSGEPFDRETTVGITYIMKLSHLIEDKIHARSVGPYSLVTQQPLGGKAQHGGQRFGEMEVWALEAYGAAHTLQEMLTIKSDDVYGRAKAYESIVKGETIKKPRTPESFNVLVKELQSLGLSVKLLQTDKPEMLASEEEEYTIEQSLEEEAAMKDSVSEKDDLDENLAENLEKEGVDPETMSEKDLPTDDDSESDEDEPTEEEIAEAEELEKELEA